MKRRFVPASLLLLALVAAVYAPVLDHEFVRFDDGVYIEENPWVRRGLTWDGVRWAFTTFHASNWHPLTWLSHMLDAELFGPGPRAAHGVNVALHAANAVLVLRVLARMTGRFWPALVVAALFAAHPLRVESVAWAAERKDLLCALFGLLALGAYERYARRPGAARYLPVLAWMALGLMAKPMLVTLPAALLLLDFWPLGRWRLPAADPARGSAARGPESLGRLLLEKLPLAALSLASAAVTVLSQWRGGSVGSLEAIPLGVRLANAAVAYAAYLESTIWPRALACFYPYPAWDSAGAVRSLALRAAGAAVVLGAISLACLRPARRRPYLAVGWLWYLGTLVPVIGAFQVGMQAMADRYTYLPSIGLYLAVVWGVAEAVFPAGAALAGRGPAGPPAAVGRGGAMPGRRWLPHTVAAATALIVLALAVSARLQVRHWHDTGSLFTRALDVTSENAVAHVNLGNDFERSGRPDLAREHYERSLAIVPSARAHVGLANVLARAGDPDRAQRHYEDALRVDPRYAPAHNNLGVLLTRQGRLEEAVEHCRAAVRIDPGYAEAHKNLGVLLGRLGRFAEAEAQFERAIAAGMSGAEPRRNLAFVLERQGKLEGAAARYEEALALEADDAESHRRLAEILHAQGKPAPALSHLRRALELDPGSLAAANRLAWILATAADESLRDGAEALTWATRCAEATAHEDPTYLETLAAAHAELGDLAAAVRWQERAAELTPAVRRSRPLARLQLYRLQSGRAR